MDQTTSSVKFEGSASKGAALSAAISALPGSYRDYFIQLSQDSKNAKAPEIPEITGEGLSEAVSPDYEEAAQSDDKPLNEFLAKLKIGQATMKFLAEPPFWACGFTRTLIPNTEEEVTPTDDEGASPSAELN